MSRQGCSDVQVFVTVFVKACMAFVCAGGAVVVGRSIWREYLAEGGLAGMLNETP